MSYNLLDLLDTKNSSIGDVILYLVSNVDFSRTVENCSVREVAKHCRCSNMVVFWTFKFLEEQNYAKRFREPLEKTRLVFESSFLKQFKSPESYKSLIASYIKLSNEIDAATNKMSEYARKENRKKTK